MRLVLCTTARLTLTCGPLMKSIVICHRRRCRSGRLSILQESCKLNKLLRGVQISQSALLRDFPTRRRAAFSLATTHNLWLRCTRGPYQRSDWPAEHAWPVVKHLWPPVYCRPCIGPSCMQLSRANGLWYRFSDGYCLFVCRSVGLLAMTYEWPWSLQKRLLRWSRCNLAWSGWWWDGPNEPCINDQHRGSDPHGKRQFWVKDGMVHCKLLGLLALSNPTTYIRYCLSEKPILGHLENSMWHLTYRTQGHHSCRY